MNKWFNMFKYEVIDGNIASFRKNPFSMILTASTAKKYFGNTEALGKTLKVDSINYKVEAIVKDNPANSSFQFNILIPNAGKVINA